MSSDHQHRAENFVHLHLHTEYSLLDGFARIEHVVQYAKELGMPALAISDHGTMFGVIDFYKACQEVGIKPVIGVESYLARRTIHDRDPQKDVKPYHMLLLARNRAGYQNLLKLCSIGQLEGYYYRPRVDRDILAAHARGLIATSGCLAAEIPRLVDEGREDDARRMIGWYQDVFGKDSFFLELQAHNIPELHKLNRWLIENANYAHVPLVATNDVHYVRPEDYDPHDILLCIQTGTVRNDANRMRMSGGNSYYLRTQAEMWKLFGDVPDALRNTLFIAEMCEDLHLDDNEYHLPIFPVPEEFPDAGEFLRYLCEKGAEWRYGSHAYSGDVQERLNYELTVIHEMGFDTYFLIVWDLCEFARSKNIWWNVRGSGAGSLVAYVLGITALDPLEVGLLFERFLNPGRVSMPDLDIDYPEDRRFEMVEYCTRKYGEDKVAAIITFGTLGAKAAIRDVGRAFDMPLTEVDRIARLVPATTKPPKISQLLGLDKSKPELASKDFIELYQTDLYARQVIDTAMHLEGTPRHVSTHAAGIIVADLPLVEYIPLHRPTKNTEDDDNPVKMVTQFPMETVESLGLLKIDFLGLSTLTILRKACELIEKYHGVRYDMSNIPYKPDPDDPETTHKVEAMFEMLGRGESIGVFQLESSGMRQMLKGMHPQNFEHIMAGVALYRPGPMQFIPQFNKRLRGEERVEYLHPKLAPIIGDTFGIIVYQEQIMKIAAQLFGYSLGEADLMRKAVSKKREKDLKLHRDIFIERGPEHGVDPDSAAAIFDQIEFFANYGFNRSHSADYAVITCQTAFLKCHYPHEYMTALMSVYYDDSAKVSLFASDCYRMGINILPPNVNYSYHDFTIEQAADGSRHIRFGMGAVKNAGTSAIDHIIECRDREGPFADLDDFLTRCDMRVIGKRALESLIRVGALDHFGERPVLLHNLDHLMSHSIEHHKAADVGQITMFDLFSNSDGTPSAGSVWSTFETPAKLPDKREQLRWEKELMGFYVTDHPLGDLSGVLQNIITHNSAELNEERENIVGKQVRVAGLVTHIRPIATKTGDTMAIVQLEDVQGLLPCVFFPKTWGLYRSLVVEDKVVIVKGKVDLRNDEVQIIVEEISQDITVAQAAEIPARLYDQEPLRPVSSAHQVDDPRQDDFYPLEGDIGPFEEDEMALALPPDEPPAFFEDELIEPVWEAVPPPAMPRNGQRNSYPLKNDHKPAPEKANVMPRQRLIVTMYRTRDLEADFRKLKLIHNIASSYPGQDELCICIYVEGVDGVYEMTFPELKIGICEEMLEHIERAKPGAVTVESIEMASD